MVADLLDLTDKNSSEWNLSSEESDIEDIAENQRGKHDRGKEGLGENLTFRG